MAADSDRERVLALTTGNDVYVTTREDRTAVYTRPHHRMFEFALDEFERRERARFQEQASLGRLLQ